MAESVYPHVPVVCHAPTASSVPCISRSLTSPGPLALRCDVPRLLDPQTLSHPCTPGRRPLHRRVQPFDVLLDSHLPPTECWPVISFLCCVCLTLASEPRKMSLGVFTSLQLPVSPSSAGIYSRLADGSTRDGRLLTTDSASLHGIEPFSISIFFMMKSWWL